MQKFIETINNVVKLITSLLTLGIFGGFIFGGLWMYQKVGEMTSKPIRLPSIELPDVNVPKVHIEAPDIELPSIKFPGQKPNIDTSRWHWRGTGRIPRAPPAPPPPGTPKPAPSTNAPDLSDIQA